MKENLNKIFELEDAGDFNEAFRNYKRLLEETNSEFNVWKYYFFFLWSMIEDIEGSFTSLDNLRNELENQLKFGLANFNENSEFNFIAGYTISIFPYEFGDYKELETKSEEMLKKAADLSPGNNIYKMVYLANRNTQETDYLSITENAGKEVLKKFSGPGLLNKYFSQVLYRI